MTEKELVRALGIVLARQIVFVSSGIKHDDVSNADINDLGESLADFCTALVSLRRDVNLSQDLEGKE
jgi:hypothetical protein